MHKVLITVETQTETLERVADIVSSCQHFGIKPPRLIFNVKTGLILLRTSLSPKSQKSRKVVGGHTLDQSRLLLRFIIVEVRVHCRPWAFL